MSEAFNGIRIIDFTRFIAGPFGTFQFALQGADVIKIEPPEGDETRDVTLDREWADKRMAPPFLALNINKRSVQLDLGSAQGQEVVRRLVANADVVWENFRPGVMARFGLDYETLRKINPRLVYCALSGFGQTGPDKHTAAFDGKIQAMSGIMSITGDPAGGPMRAGFAVCDLIGGMTAAFAVASALHHRHDTGFGQQVDVSMLDATLNFLCTNVADYTVTKVRQRQFGNLSVSRKVTAHRFRAGSGDLVLAVLTNKQFNRLLSALGRDDVMQDPRFRDWISRSENEAALREIIEGGMQSGTPEYWQQVLTDADVPCAVVKTIDEIVSHPQVKARGVLRDVTSAHGTHAFVGPGFKLSQSSEPAPRAAPELGEHTREVLEAAGFTDEEITYLIEAGIATVACSKTSVKTNHPAPGR